MARALLTPSTILVLDEATAAVDVQTDTLLQSTLRTPAFRSRTIITIAHRINTILDSDRIIVLKAGEVAEFDTPRNLVERRGLFYELVKESGLLDTDGGIEGSLRRMMDVHNPDGNIDSSNSNSSRIISLPEENGNTFR